MSRPKELSGWEGELPNAVDYKLGSTRYVVQSTEDGCYGFIFRLGEEVASMVGPTPDPETCNRLLRQLVSPGRYV